MFINFILNFCFLAIIKSNTIMITAIIQRSSISSSCKQFVNSNKNKRCHHVFEQISYSYRRRQQNSMIRKYSLVTISNDAQFYFSNNQKQQQRIRSSFYRTAAAYINTNQFFLYRQQIADDSFPKQYLCFLSSNNNNHEDEYNNQPPSSSSSSYPDIIISEKSEQKQEQNLYIQQNPYINNDDDNHNNNNFVDFTSFKNEKMKLVEYQYDNILSKKLKLRTWKRLLPIMEMSLLVDHHMMSCNIRPNENEKQKKTIGRSLLSIVDVGTDHGILALGLSFMNHFHQVIGIDSSQLALQDGAYQLFNTSIMMLNHQQHQLSSLSSLETSNSNNQNNKNNTNNESSNNFIVAGKNSSSSSSSLSLSSSHQNPLYILKSSSIISDLEFRHGNGLFGLKNNNECDIVCIAGMGVNTMISILLSSSSSITSSSSTNDNDLHEHEQQEQNQYYRIHEMNCQAIIIQTTDSKPSSLVRLYDILYHQLHYELYDEDILYTSNRWHVTSCFIKRNNINSSNINNNNKDGQLLRTDEADLPGATLKQKEQKYQQQQQQQKQKQQQESIAETTIFQRWVKHHAKWIQSNRNKQNKIKFDPDQSSITLESSLRYDKKTNEDRWMQLFDIMSSDNS